MNIPNSDYDGITRGAASISKNDNNYPLWFLPEPNEEKWKIALCDNFVGYGRLWRETNIRLDKFYSRPDINIANKELNIKNDMRHITGLAFFTQMFGASKTRLLGYTKEFKDMLFEHDLDDTKIDLNNNKIGILLGEKYPTLERDKLIELIYNIYIKPKRRNKT